MNSNPPHAQRLSNPQGFYAYRASGGDCDHCDPGQSSFACSFKSKRKAHNIICLNNLRQTAVAFRVAIDTDEGNFGFRRPTGPTDDWVRLYSQTGQGRFWQETWGNTNQNSICPAAPARPLAKRPPAIVNASHFYSGTVDSAWSAEGPGGWWNWLSRPGPVSKAGSYTANGWVASLGWGWYGETTVTWPPEVFLSESEIRDVSRTPLFGDGIFFHYLGWGAAHWQGPRESDQPPQNLRMGVTPGPPFGMGTFSIPRHGSVPRVIPTNHPIKSKLPGSINLVFYDGHAEQVQLEKLWAQKWHKNWRAGKRPSL